MFFVCFCTLLVGGRRRQYKRYLQSWDKSRLAEWSDWMPRNKRIAADHLERTKEQSDLPKTFENDNGIQLLLEVPTMTK